VNRRLGRCFFRLSVLGILILASGVARAGTLTNATWFQVTQGVPMTRSFAQLGASGSSTATSIAVNLSYPFFQTTVYVPGTAIDLSTRITFGGPQAITATPGMGSGTPGVPGTVAVMTAIHIAKGVNQSMFLVGHNTLVRVPLSVGKAGRFTGTFTVVGALHQITVDFYGWTPGVVQFAGLTTKGAALPNVTAQGSFGLTQDGGGTVTLVSPAKLSVDGALAQRRTAAFSKLKLSFAARKVTVCHKANRTLSISVTSLPAHLAHGDSLGGCD
jgi:hypothetical protein